MDTLWSTRPELWILRTSAENPRSTTFCCSRAAWTGPANAPRLTAKVPGTVPYAKAGSVSISPASISNTNSVLQLRSDFILNSSMVEEAMLAWFCPGKRCWCLLVEFGGLRLFDWRCETLGGHLDTETSVSFTCRTYLHTPFYACLGTQRWHRSKPTVIRPAVAVFMESRRVWPSMCLPPGGHCSYVSVPDFFDMW